jgi:hypothetical protein
MNKRSRKKQSSWESSSWWARTPLSYFEPLICFASQEIDEANWKKAIWQALGSEKLSDVTYRTKDGSVQRRMWAADISPDETITEVKRVIPTIFRQEATLQLAKQLRGKVKQILDSIVAKTAAVERQRGGKEGIAWIELGCCRFQRHPVRCMNETGGGSWSDGSLRESLSWRRCS